MRLPSRPAEILLIHHPGCSKCRKTLELLRERGLAFEERRYLEDPLSVRELSELERRLGLPLAAFVRRDEPAWSEAFSEGEPGADELRAGVAAHPALLQRPILVRGTRAVVARPPERALELLDPAR